MFVFYVTVNFVFGFSISLFKQLFMCWIHILIFSPLVCTATPTGYWYTEGIFRYNEVLP
jgi:hypothetical protein